MAIVYPNEMPLQLPNLRSQNHNDRVNVRFINLTNREVEVVWINYTGQFVKYRLLGNRDYADINTFKTHPWIALDARTKDRLLIDGNFVFMPRPWREYAPENCNRRFPEGVEPRVLVKIMLPLYSLRFRTLLEVRNFFKEPEDCESLELPAEIKEDLKRSIEQRNRTKLTPILQVQ